MEMGRGREVLSGTEARLTGTSPYSEEWLSQSPDSRLGADGGTLDLWLPGYCPHRASEEDTPTRLTVNRSHTRGGGTRSSCEDGTDRPIWN